jgi:hypothetical protein
VRKKISRSAVVTPAMRNVEAEQYPGEACDNDDSEVCRAARGLRLDLVPALFDAVRNS